jgi:hypothetical protein
VKKGNSSSFTQGSWVHPLLATHLAQWISVSFFIKVSLWIDEWKNTNNNKIIYNKALEDIKPNNNNLCVEKQIQSKMYNELGGNMEVET